MSLVERIGEHRDELTDSEQAIARYIAMNYTSVAYDSASSIAQKCEVSGATATRFFTKLGYDSFAEVQREVRAEISERLTSPLTRLDSTAGAAASAADVLALTLERDLDNLRLAAGGIQSDHLLGMAELLVQCRGTVFIYGEKKAHAIGFYLYAQLNLCIEHVELLTAEQSLLPDRLLRIGSDDILLVIDARRYVRTTLQAARTFRERGAKVLILGDSETSPLAKMADFGIYFPVEGAFLFDSYTALMFAANAISNIATFQRTAETAARVKEAERLWDRFEIFNAKGGN